MISFKKALLSLLILSVVFVLNSKAQIEMTRSHRGFYYKQWLCDKHKTDYDKAVREFNIKTGKLIEMYVDFQLGVGVTSANVNSSSNGVRYETESRTGFTTGALIYISLFESVKFSTGLTFDGKSFGIERIVDTSIVSDSSLNNFSGYFTSNYLNIPLNLNFGGMITDDFGLWFNGGPYLGFLLSSPNSQYSGIGYKNFDLGLNGTITGNYIIQYPFSIIFGTSFKFGGLNNLASTESVESVRTTNFNFFSGIRIGF